MLQIHRYYHPRPQNKTAYEHIKVNLFPLSVVLLHVCEYKWQELLAEDAMSLTR